MSIFSRKPSAPKIRSTRAGRVLDDAKRDVKRKGKDEVAEQRNKKSGGKK